jgi:uncharacterized protein
MKLELQDTSGAGRNWIDAYSAGRVVVAGSIFQHSLIVSPAAGARPWAPQCFDEITCGHVESIASLGPDVVLIGTGARLRFPEPAVLAPLHSVGIGVEIMDTGAACRSYNFLSGEGRNVVAALLMIES